MVKKPSRKGDWPWLLLFALFNGVCILWARSHFLSFQKATQEMLVERASQVPDAAWLPRLEEVAQKGQWRDFEKQRKALWNTLEKRKEQPESGAKEYFFPESLPERSLKKTFAEWDLAPLLHRLQTACETQAQSETEALYQSLKRRVESYERGMQSTLEGEPLSSYALHFLRLYRILSQNCLASHSTGSKDSSKEIPKAFSN